MFDPSKLKLIPHCKLNYEVSADIAIVRESLRRQMGSNYRPLPFNDPKLFRGVLKNGSFKLRRRTIARAPWEPIAIISFNDQDKKNDVHVSFRPNYFFLLLGLLLIMSIDLSVYFTNISFFYKITACASVFVSLYGVYIYGFWRQVKKLRLEIEKTILIKS